ncbi:MAG: hypothetical protein KDK27_12465 [Leptospiraceae bacterium]|nr:hypothetical protein [Leptospiraceae bacterium]
MPQTTSLLMQFLTYVLPILQARQRNLWISGALLVLANLTPLAGVLWLNWDWTVLLFLYWLENLMIGGITLLRLPISGFFSGEIASRVLSVIIAIFLMLFFTVHYGMFCLVHGLFLGVLMQFGGGPVIEGDLFTAVESFAAMSWGSPDQLRYVQLGVIVLLLSHFTSFLLHFLGGGEFRTGSPMREMMRPYGRVVVMHITIILGIFAMVLIGFYASAVIVWVLLKIIMDLRAHTREHLQTDVDSNDDSVSNTSPT